MFRGYRDNGEENGNFFSIVYMGIMEKNMETSLVYWGLYGDNGKENGNYYSRIW